MQFSINGQPRNFPNLHAGATLAELIEELAIKADRIAVEHNGEIVPRSSWSLAAISEGDRFEIVHFVGGGCR